MVYRAQPQCSHCQGETSGQTCPACRRAVCKTCRQDSLCPIAYGRRYKLGFFRRLIDINPTGGIGLMRDRRSDLSFVHMSEAIKGPSIIPLIQPEQRTSNALIIYPDMVRIMAGGEIAFVDSGNIYAVKGTTRRPLVTQANEHYGWSGTMDVVDSRYVTHLDQTSLRALDLSSNRVFDFSLTNTSALAISHPGQIRDEGLLAVAHDRELQVFSFERTQSYFRRQVAPDSIVWLGFGDHHDVWLIDATGYIMQFEFNALGTNVDRNASVKFHPGDEHPIWGHPKAIFGKFAALSGDLLVVAESGRRLVVRRLPSMNLLQEIELSDDVCLLRFVDEGKALVVADDDSYVYILRRTNEGIDINWNDHSLAQA